VIGAIVLLSCAIVLAACGGGSKQGGQSPSPSAASQGSSQGAAAQAAAQQKSLAFAACVRKHGVPNFPDPINGHFLISSSVQSSPQFQSATQACQKLLPNGLNGGASQGANNSALLNFAQCMRSHGVPNFPDPDPNGAIDLHGIDPNSSQFQQAAQTCEASTGVGLGQ
jgi:hypothetical protein